mgnify:CR=1 FL=1
MELQIIQSKIYGIRGQKVMLDFDLAGLYQVETRVLNQAVKRNSKQFPTDFMFRLNTEEWEILKSQIVISSWGGTRKLPYAFTEQGPAMLSGISNSDTAIQVNINIMRAFVAMRRLISNPPVDKNAELREEMKKLKDYMEEIFGQTRESDPNLYNRLWWAMRTGGIQFLLETLDYTNEKKLIRYISQKA